jgi:hypothetical protein
MNTSCVGRHNPPNGVSKQNWCKRQPCRAYRNLDLLTVGHTLRRNESRYPIRASQGGGDDRAPWRQRATSRIQASYKPPPPLSTPCTCLLYCSPPLRLDTSTGFRPTVTYAAPSAPLPCLASPRADFLPRVPPPRPQWHGYCSHSPRWLL